jgi:exonuclease III
MSYNIGTLNVRTFTDNTKQQVLFNTFINHNFDIIAIQETNISNLKQSKAFSKSLPPTHKSFLSHHTDSQRIGFGVGLILKKEYADHVYHHHTEKGRFQLLDLQFKNKHKLRIINLYSPYSNDELRSDIFNKTKTKILDAFQNNMSIILLGDFNADPNRPRNIKYSHQFFRDLDALNLINTYSLVPHNHNDLLNSYHGKPTPSRIDHIYLSHDLISQFLDHTVIEMDPEITDHNIVSNKLYLNTFITTTARTSTYKKLTFLYDRMTDQSWNLFAEKTDDLLRKSPSHILMSTILQQQSCSITHGNTYKIAL